MQVLQFIIAHWIEWLFLIITSVISVICKNIWKKLKFYQDREDAIADGLQSLLRESIVNNYLKSYESKCCSIYTKESIKKVYDSYHNLGGNDVATKLYSKILAMPEEQIEEKEEWH